MLINIIAHPVADRQRLERAARAEVERILGPGFRFPQPAPLTSEIRFYLYIEGEHAWFVVLPTVGTIDTWTVDHADIPDADALPLQAAVLH
jgi:hypothetical protein